jgi:hypothetical protein
MQHSASDLESISSNLLVDVSGGCDRGSRRRGCVKRSCSQSTTTEQSYTEETAAPPPPAPVIAPTVNTTVQLNYPQA